MKATTTYSELFLILTSSETSIYIKIRVLTSDHKKTNKNL